MEHFDSFKSDVAFAWRQLRKSPGFAAAATLTIAVGTGASVAVFSLVNAALFRPVYAERPDELVEVVAGDLDGRAFSGHSYANYLDCRDRSRDVVTGLATFLPYDASLVIAGRTERASVGLVSDNYFSVLGIRMLAGRAFLPHENTNPGSHFVAVIAESVWRRHFGASTDLANVHVSINNAPYEVIGVVPERAARLFNVIRVDVFVPAVMQGPVRGGRHWLFERGNREFGVVGRLRPDVGMDEARTRFSAIGQSLQREYPEAWVAQGRPIPLTVAPASTVGVELRGALIGVAGLLMAAVGCVLLIVCANLANLLAARTSTRRGEVAVRAALGASRGRIVRQLLTETLVLTTLGGVLGVVIAAVTTRFLGRLAPTVGVPLVVDLTLDHRVLAFGIGAALLTAAAFGLSPALEGTRISPAAILHGAAPTMTPGRRRVRVRNALMIGQVAASLLLVICGAMFLRSLDKLHSIDRGFTRKELALLSVSLGGRGYSPAEGRVFLQRIIPRLAALPGVEGVTVAARVPMGLSRGRIQVRPTTDEAAADPVYAGFNAVGPDYFQVMELPIVRGRPLNTSDREHAPPVAIVNEALAARFWPDADPVGQQIHTESGALLRVVGVARNSKYENITERPFPFLYFPLEQSYRPNLTFHVRLNAADPHLVEALRREIVSVDPLMAVFDVQMMDDHLADSLLPIRAGAILAGALGAIGLAVASIGLYGLMAYSVSQRTKEIGIRLALGAHPRTVRRLIVRNGLALASAGAVIGLIAGAGATAAIATQLYGVTPTDVVTLLIVASTQIAIAFAACWVPARRATMVDPLETLRQE